MVPQLLVELTWSASCVTMHWHGQCTPKCACPHPKLRHHYFKVFVLTVREYAQRLSRFWFVLLVCLWRLTVVAYTSKNSWRANSENNLGYSISRSGGIFDQATGSTCFLAWLPWVLWRDGENIQDSDWKDYRISLQRQKTEDNQKCCIIFGDGEIMFVGRSLRERKCNS